MHEIILANWNLFCIPYAGLKFLIPAKDLFRKIFELLIFRLKIAQNTSTSVPDISYLDQLYSVAISRCHIGKNIPAHF